MSLVGLKNLFFQRTLVPAQPRHGAPLLDPSRTPLLGNNERTEVPVEDDAGSRDEISDLESQTTVGESRLEKPRQKNGEGPNSRLISDATIGLSDGLTVPFALTAGLSALGSTNIVIWGGFAELIAGAISMGLGGYVAAKGEAVFYYKQREEVEEMVLNNPRAANDAIVEAFEPYDVPASALEEIIERLSKSPQLPEFIMRFQHCEEEPDSARAIKASGTIAAGYFIGGLIPLLPYLAVGQLEVYKGLYWSIAVMVVALFIFGYAKMCVVIGWKGGRQIRRGCLEGVKMVIVGSIAAAAAMGLVKCVSGNDTSTVAAVL